MSTSNFRKIAAVGSAIVVVTGVALVSGCGKSKVKATDISMTITESGKKATYQAPTAAKGGLVKLSLTNNGKKPHSAQLILVTQNHTAADALKQVNSNSNKVPEWLRAEGGAVSVPPGQTQSATVNLPAGKYVVVDTGPTGPSSKGPPASTELQLSAGDMGDLPSTDATVTAANPAKDKYKWEVSGLKVGDNDVTFNSKGKQALHFMVATPLKPGTDPSVETIKKDLGSNGPPPPYLDFNNGTGTSVLDGGKSETAKVSFKKPGTYVFICFFSDRDGGKPHFEEGLLSKETVK